MFSKLREVLLTQSIGSILVALLVWQAAVEVITTVVRTGIWQFNHRQSESVLAGSSSSPFPWESLLLPVVSIVLYLLTAYVLARWLYPTPSPAAQPDLVDESTDPNQSEPS